MNKIFFIILIFVALPLNSILLQNCHGKPIYTLNMGDQLEGVY